MYSVYFIRVIMRLSSLQDILPKPGRVYYKDFRGKKMVFEENGIKRYTTSAKRLSTRKSAIKR